MLAPPMVRIPSARHDGGNPEVDMAKKTVEKKKQAPSKAAKKDLAKQDAAKKKLKDAAAAREAELKAIAKKLEGRVKKLEAAVASAEAKAAKWMKRAKKDRADAEASSARVSKLEKKLAKAQQPAPKTSVGAPRPTLAVAPDAPAQSDEVAPPVEVVAIETPAEPAPGPASKGSPDDSWTVTALRAEARSRGLAGYSRKSKAELLSALS
jgi:hypothetical protein